MYIEYILSLLSSTIMQSINLIIQLIKQRRNKLFVEVSFLCRPKTLKQHFHQGLYIVTCVKHTRTHAHTHTHTHHTHKRTGALLAHDLRTELIG